MIHFWDDRIVPWVAARIPGCRGFGEARGLVIAHHDRIVAGVVFHNWDPDAGTIEVSGASEHRRWVSPAVFRTITLYAFDGLNCQAIVARHAESNHAARHIWNAVGASEHIIPHLYGRGQAGCIAVLTEEAWARSRFNKSARQG